MRFIGSTKGRYGWEHPAYSNSNIWADHVKISDFSMQAHACSCLLIHSFGLSRAQYHKHTKHTKSHDTNFPWGRVDQGRIHGYQLQTGGQGRICAFSHFSTRSPLRTDRPTDRPTNRRTDKASYRVACPQLKTIFNRVQSNLGTASLVCKSQLGVG